MDLLFRLILMEDTALMVKLQYVQLKYANEPLDEQCDFYRSEGFPEQYGLYECGVSARDLTNRKGKRSWRACGTSRTLNGHIKIK
jgi:hypothetical protein